MKYVMVAHAGQERPGVLEGDSVLLLEATGLTEVVQSGAELSFGMSLRPGDLLLTGTPAGIGNAREPQVFLQDGDLVVTRADKLGELRNRVTLV
jgi:2-keto-4-pentenoate hydratase/2-oxohepta-3-ene-1,7-dioic acid hydratase in catechol pathway